MKKSNPTSLFVRIWAALNQRDPRPCVYILADASFWWRHIINIFIPLLLSNLFSLSFSSLEKAALWWDSYILNPLLVSDAGWMPTVSHMLLEQVLPRKAFCDCLGGSSAASAWCHRLPWLFFEWWLAIFSALLYPQGYLCWASFSALWSQTAMTGERMQKLLTPKSIACLGDLFLGWNFCSGSSNSCRTGLKSWQTVQFFPVSSNMPVF